MTKYNITEPKEKKSRYRTLVNPKFMDDMKDRILEIIVMNKKYKDPDYSAKQLAEDLGTNTRYISAIVNTKFHSNCTTFVNKYRIEEAMSITHTRTFPGHEGRGVAAGMMEVANDYAVKHQIKVLPICSYAWAWYQRHPQFSDILDEHAGEGVSCQL